MWWIVGAVVIVLAVPAVFLLAFMQTIREWREIGDHDERSE